MTSPFALDRTYLIPGSRLCVAISGGADSVALLTHLVALNGLAREGLGAGLTAVHVHHGMRGREADSDAAFVEELCGSLEVPLTVRRVDVPGYARESGETVEEAARTLRYQVFDGLLVEGAADVLLTAHTLDDQAETVLMKLLRGAWTAGLSGIHPVLTRPRGRIARPMLGATRAEIVGYLEGQGRAWREDASNADPAHTRNRLRHAVLPLLRAENPSLDRTLAHVAELAREEEARWEKELARLLPQILLPGKPVRGGGRAVGTAPGSAAVAIELERLRALDGATRRRVLRAAVAGLGGSLTFDETARVLALCGLGEDRTVNARAGGILELARGLRAERTAREIQLSRRESPVRDA